MEILILDIETTGFLKDKGSIVEIGIVKLNLENGKIETIYDSLCIEKDIFSDEHLESPLGWIFKNSDLKADDVCEAKDFTVVKSEVQKIINNYPLGCTAYNNKFDFDYLEDRGVEFVKKLSCPMLLSTNVCKIKGKYGYKWPSVEEAYKFFFPEIEYKELHRGADDAFHEAQIVYELYKLNIFKI